MGSNSDCEQLEESFPKKWHFLWFQRNVSLKTVEEEHSRQTEHMQKGPYQTKRKKKKTLLVKHENGEFSSAT